MRYKEFKKAIEEWGEKYHYEPVVEDRSDYYFIEIAFGNGDYTNTVCTIHKSIRFVIDFNWGLYKNFFENARNDLFKIVTEFAATKPEDREDEKVKKYKFKHKFLGSPGNDYLTYYARRNRWLLLSGIETSDFKVNFTIEELKEKFNSNLDDWEIIEVEE